jgi:hypothetical protein
MGSEVSTAQVELPQGPAAGFPTPSPPGSIVSHPILQGHPNFPDRCVSPRGSTELTVFTEPAQVKEVLVQRKEGELNAGSGSAMEKGFSEQLQLDSRELFVVCSEAGPVRVRESSEQLQLKTDNLIVPWILTGTESWPQPLVDIAFVPCIDSAGGEGSDWKGGLVLESESSGLQVGDEGETSSGIHPGGAELVEFKAGEQVEEAGTPLNAYSPASGGLGHFDWVIQCANEIYPILGMSIAGHNLQLLAF